MRFLGIETLWLHYKLLYYRWAVREMDPLNRDLPTVVIKLNALERRIREGK